MKTFEVQVPDAPEDVGAAPAALADDVARLTQTVQSQSTALAQLSAATIAQAAALKALTDAMPAPNATLWNRVMGACTGKKNYDDPTFMAAMAKCRMVTLGLYKGWRGDVNGSKVRPLLQALKQLNPNLLIGQYTQITECPNDPLNPANASRLDEIQRLTSQNEWLRTSAGAPVQYTSEYQSFDVNFTEFTKPDATGKRYAQWAAQHDYDMRFGPCPEFDLWFHDNVMWRSRQTTPANWRLDGRDVNGNVDVAMQAAWRRGMASHIAEAERLAPSVVKMGNADNDLSFPEYAGLLDAAFLEGLIGKNWSLETNGGWKAMMQRYRTVLRNVKDRSLTVFHVAGAAADYPTFRYGLCSALLEDGLFCYSTTDYGVPLAYDEYDVQLGEPDEDPPIEPFTGEVWARRYAGGIVFVNAGKSAASFHIPSGYRRFLGLQAPEVNTGRALVGLTLNPRDGIVLVTA
jgi:hypothetical protein